jgi:hypothetical protein
MLRREDDIADLGRLPGALSGLPLLQAPGLRLLALAQTPLLGGIVFPTTMGFRFIVLSCLSLLRGFVRWWCGQVGSLAGVQSVPGLVASSRTGKP